MRNEKCKKKPCILLFAFCILHFASAALRAAEGLSTPFADVQVSHIPLGVATRVRDAGGPDLVLQNTGDHPIKVQVEILTPSARDLRSTAQAIPDVHWVQVVPVTVLLSARQSAVCSVIITVPDEKKYAHKTYQVMIWSHSRPDSENAVSIGAGLLSRLRFTTGRR